MREANVLVVDDDEDIRRSLKSLLEDEVPNVRVTGFAEGQAALAFMKEQAVSLIITDYRMPKMDGIAFLQMVRRIHPEVPAILLTAYPQARLANQARQHAGVVMAKPLDLDYLVAIVKAAVEGRLGHGP